MNEADTRYHLIDPMLKDCGWGIVKDSRISAEYIINFGKIEGGGKKTGILKADYILIYKGIKVAVIEAKSENTPVGEGVAQAKYYAQKLNLPFAYSTNGNDIYEICLKTGEEKTIKLFPTPDELWNKINNNNNDKSFEFIKRINKFNSIPFEFIKGKNDIRYYQEIAVNNVLDAIADNKKRILLTLATGTGKTVIAFQIAWKLFKSRWNINFDESRQPRILFLADRNILADQAFNKFSAFDQNALVRIKPEEINKSGKVPVNGNIFFTIFQTFMSGKDNNNNSVPYFGQYPTDYFDLIIIDECHRGGANDEGSWRGILEYFSSAVQIGLTATPKRKDNVDTYRYFGEPVYIYSLKEGINDGFLTPFKIQQITTALDEYVYNEDDEVIEGNVEEGKVYVESDFNKIIEIKERERLRVKLFMDNANPNDKTIVFCASQAHAAVIRDLINEYNFKRLKQNDLNYCVRVTANDGNLGEQYLREFQDNEKTIPTILTTSQKLSTGVDALNIRNIVLFRQIKTMIEFKQIIGRGTRLFDGKEFFTIYDFVKASHHFEDKEWDGEPVESNSASEKKESEEQEPKICLICNKQPCECKKTVKIQLKEGKEYEITYFIRTKYLDFDGKLITVEEYLSRLFGILPNFFESEEKLREIWSNINTRNKLLSDLEKKGFDKDKLIYLKKYMNAENCDLFDVLNLMFSKETKPIPRKIRVNKNKDVIFNSLTQAQKDFVEFLIDKYVEFGEYEISNVGDLVQTKYQSINDGINFLGDLDKIRSLFNEFQKHLYE